MSFQDEIYSAMHRKLKEQQAELEKLRAIQGCQIPARATESMSDFTGPIRVHPVAPPKQNLPELQDEVDNLMEKMKAITLAKERQIYEQKMRMVAEEEEQLREMRAQIQAEHSELVKQREQAERERAEQAEREQRERTEREQREQKERADREQREQREHHEHAVQAAREERARQMEAAREIMRRADLRSPSPPLPPPQSSPPPVRRTDVRNVQNVPIEPSMGMHEQLRVDVWEPLDRSERFGQHMSEQELFESDVEDIVRTMKGGKKMLEAYYSLDAVINGCPEEEAPYPARTPGTPGPATPGTPGTRESHDIEIIETLDGEKLLNIDGVYIKYEDAATAVAYYASE